MFQVITWSDDGDLETARLGVDWVNLAQERDKWWAAVITVVSPWVLWNARDFSLAEEHYPESDETYEAIMSVILCNSSEECLLVGECYQVCEMWGAYCGVAEGSGLLACYTASFRK